jgi:hypothetical protein
MKLKHVILSLTMIAMISCTPKKEASEEATDDAAVNEMIEDETVVSGVYFVDLTDGATVSSPVIVNMGVSGMEIEPAGTVNEGKGHHHIIIDGTFAPAGETVPADETHIHYGKGQTADTLDLAPGQHTITLQFANGVHASFGEEWSKTISITVEGGAQ